MLNDIDYTMFKKHMGLNKSTKMRRKNILDLPNYFPNNREDISLSCFKR